MERLDIQPEDLVLWSCHDAHAGQFLQLSQRALQERIFEKWCSAYLSDHANEEHMSKRRFGP